jgi:hypothetical protein
LFNIGNPEIDLQSQTVSDALGCCNAGWTEVHAGNFSALRREPSRGDPTTIGEVQDLASRAGPYRFQHQA